MTSTSESVTIDYARDEPPAPKLVQIDDGSGGGGYSLLAIVAAILIVFALAGAFIR